MAGLMPVQTTGALLSMRGGRARGKASSGKNYWYNDIAFRQAMYNKMRAMLVSKAQDAAEYASSQMKDLGGEHAPSGTFPAEQSGNLKDAMSYEYYFENRRWMVARFGVFGDVANRSQADYSDEYSDETPVGVYAYTLATGIGRMGKRWPWVEKTLQKVAEDGWQDAEVDMNVVRDYAV